MTTPNQAASQMVAALYRVNGPNNEPLPASCVRWGLSRGVTAPVSMLTSQNTPPPPPP